MGIILSVTPVKAAVRNKILLLVLLAVLAAAARLSGLTGKLTIENVKAHKEAVHLYVEAHPLSSTIAYVSVYALAVALSIPGAMVLTIAGGFLFGVLKAVLCVNAGALAGSAIAFLITRYLLGNWLQEKYGPRLQQFNREIESHGPHYLLALRFSPVFPFFLVNILAGLTRIRPATFLWTTSIGILPGPCVFICRQRDRQHSLYRRHLFHGNFLRIGPSRVFQSLTGDNRAHKKT